MTDSTTEEAEREIEEEIQETESTTETTQEPVLDIDQAQSQDERIERLEETVERQREQIEELENMVLDMSVRMADGRDQGVCPDCHGPVVKKKRWIGNNTVECGKCGRVFHEY